MGLCLSLNCVYNFLTNAIKGNLFKSYFDLQNLVQLVIVIGTICFYFLSHTSIDIAVHIAGWTVFLVWIDLTLLLARIDVIGQYIYMSVCVMKTMLLLVITYTPTFLAFTF